MAVAADYIQVAQQLYVAYFGRPADVDGLASMTAGLLASGAPTDMSGFGVAYATNPTVKAYLDNFGNSDESKALYGTGTDQAFVFAVYNHVLNRDPLLAGLKFWTNALQAHTITRAEVAAQIIAAATSPTADPTDLATVTNKVAVANNFTTNIDTAAEYVGYGATAASVQQARDLLSGVTSTTNVTAYAATVASVLDSIAHPVVPVNTINLLTTADNIIGTSGADVITGTLPFVGNVPTSATLTAGDQINGAGGVDTLAITVSGALGAGADYTATPSLKNVEKVLVSNVSADTGHTVTIDLSLADSAVTNVGTSSSTNESVNTKFSNVAASVAVEQAGAGDLEISFNGVTGSSDAASLALNSVSSTNGTAVFKTTGIETLNVASNGTGNTITLNDTQLKTVNLTGTADASIAFAGGTAPTVINAAAASGSITVDGTGLVVGNITVTGGTGTSDEFITDTATVTNTTLANVKGFETLGLSGAGASATLTAAVAGVNAFDLAAAAAPNLQTLTLSTGYTGATSVSVTAGDTVVNNANVALTVTGKAAAFNTTSIAGGTGTDVIKMTADGTTSSLTNINGVETITIAAKSSNTATGVTLTGVNSAATKTVVVDASALTNSAAVLNLTAGTDSGHLSITGGAGNDVIVGGNGGDTIISGAGNDSITLGTGADSVNAGDGDDTIITGANLTSADTINGGAGTNTLVVDSVAANAFTNVTNIQNVQFSANATSITLATPLTTSAVTLDLSNAAVQSLTLATGYTGATTVKVGAGDTVVNAANVALTVTGGVTAFDGSVITGGTGVDVLKIKAGAGTAALVAAAVTADAALVTANNLVTSTAATKATADALVLSTANTAANAAAVTAAATAATNAANAVTAQATQATNTATADALAAAGAASLTSVTGVETITIGASSTLGQGATLTGVNGVAAGKTQTIDASALTDTTAVFTLTAGGSTVANSNLTIVGAAGVNNINLSGSAANNSVTTGAGADTILAGSAHDSIVAGAGNDTVTFNGANNTLTFDDTVDGGTGTNTLRIDLAHATGSTIGNSGEFAHVSNFAVLKATSAGTISIGSSTPAFATYDLGDTSAQTLTINPGYAAAVTVKEKGDGGAHDVINNVGNVALTVTGNVTDLNTTTVHGGTGVDTLTLTEDSGSASLANTDRIEQINIVGGTTASATAAITVGDTVAAGKVLTIDASAATGSVTIDASSVGNGATPTGSTVASTGAAVNVIGSAVADTITGGHGDDTINGGAGADLINAGAGNDVVTTGSGNDVVVANLNSSKFVFTQVTDMAAGDAIEFVSAAGAASTTVAAQTKLNAAATLSDYIDAASASATGASNTVIKWFQFGGNTYVVADASNNTTFDVTADKIIQLNGLIDLSTANITSDAATHTALLQLGAAAPITAVTVAPTFVDAAGTVAFAGSSAIANSFTVDTHGHLASDTIAGGSLVDTLTLTGSGGVDADFAHVTSVEHLAISGANTITLGTNAQAAGIVQVVDTTGPITLVASAYTTGLTVTATGANALAYTAGSGNDNITGSSSADTFTFGANLTSADSINGAGGGDTLKISGTVADAAFSHVYGFGAGTLDLTGVSSVTLGSLAQASGIATVTNSGNAAVTVDASAYTSAIAITGGNGIDHLIGGAGADTFTASTGADVITGGAGADTIGISVTGSTIAYTAVGQTYSGVVTTAATSLTGGADVVTFASAAADTIKVDLSGLSIAALNAVTTLTVGIAGANMLTGTAGAIAITEGAYSAGVFTAAAADGTHKDLLVQWDTNGATAGGVESIVLVGGHWTAGVDTALAASGVITVTYN